MNYARSKKVLEKVYKEKSERFKNIKILSAAISLLNSRRERQVTLAGLSP